MDKKVTIVIPTFNRADYVTKTIESALNQTVPCDIIVCDHGSSDNTPEVVSKYGDKITYIRREKDFGPHFCWLEGILNAKTEFVHLHFDDDIMQPSFVEKTLALMSEDDGMVFCDAATYDHNAGKITNPVLFNFQKRWSTGIYKSKLLEKRLLKRGLMLSPAICLYRKKDFVDAMFPGQLPVDFGGEYHGVGVDIFISLLTCLRYPKFGIVAEPLACFGVHDGSITIDAMHDSEKNTKLHKAYDSYRKYYCLIKLYKKCVLIRCITRFMSLGFIKLVKLFLKVIGLRKKG